MPPRNPIQPFKLPVTTNALDKGIASELNQLIVHPDISEQEPMKGEICATAVSGVARAQENFIRI